MFRSVWQRQGLQSPSLKAGVSKVIASDRGETELQQVINEFLPFPQVHFITGGHEQILENVDLVIKARESIRK